MPGEFFQNSFRIFNLAFGFEEKAEVRLLILFIFGILSKSSLIPVITDSLVTMGL